MKKCAGVFFLGAFLSGCASQSVQTELAAVDSAGSQSYYSSGWIVQGQKDGEYLVELGEESYEFTFVEKASIETDQRKLF